MSDRNEWVLVQTFTKGEVAAEVTTRMGRYGEKLYSLKCGRKRKNRDTNEEVWFVSSFMQGEDGLIGSELLKQAYEWCEEDKVKNPPSRQDREDDQRGNRGDRSRRGGRYED